MTINQKILRALFLMLASGKKITVYSLANEAGIDRGSIYYRIKKEVEKDEALS
ncbi:hypothetical protein MNB_SM-7-1311 [hydrothermal vent metagenome]|uniref:Helix-turn-helix type 11 domain-containing protein n=1 Tax=hydrothermal vent metagenome TaxID=652676 RepID=A0A1W1BXI9_9ZZZZ